MDIGLRNRVVLVTGSSAGIGRASAVAFGREGARVAITYHTNLDGAQATADTVRQTGAETLVLPYDLNDDASIKAAVRGVLERWGTIDVLVNNAVDLAPQEWDTMGVFEDDPPERWRRMIRSGLEGVYMTIQAAVPPMRAQGWGRIVNITSNLAEDARAGVPSYAAAKSGQHGLTRHLAWALGPAGILTNVVMPGFTLTERPNRSLPQDLFDDMKKRTCTGRLTEPEEVATTIVFLGSAANGHINGEMIRVDGGI